MTENSARTLEQRRAQNAWRAVSDVKQQKNSGVIKEDSAKEHGALARGASADVLVNGLGQTLAFWKAKGNPHHLWLYRAVSDWVLLQLRVPEDHTDLLEWIISEEAGANSYRLATAESLAYLVWMKRFAEAELPKGDPNA